jgi:ATP adenylyltransferase
MNFDQLKQFITNDMQMQQIYQPVMLIELLKRNGTATVDQIAQAILNRDPTQIEYYSEIVKNMVGRVLTKNRGITEKQNKQYHLIDSQMLSPEQIEQLILLCNQKIEEYESKSDGAHWEHRRRTRDPVTGTVRYEVLKRAKFRCELCGIPAEEKSLDVDHITPKSLGGKDDISNYQALCYTCNTQKNNRDDTDFRGLNTIYEHREEDCLFCDIQSNDKLRIISKNTLAFAVRDGFPVTEGHTLFIPKRHAADYFELSQAEINAINQLMTQQKDLLQHSDKTIEGFNIGMNCGDVAGQTIFHCHVHLIPRRKGDVENPRGGVRHIIAGKGFY